MAVGGFRGPLSVVWEPDGGLDSSILALPALGYRSAGDYHLGQSEDLAGLRKVGRDGFSMVTDLPVVNESCRPLKARCPSHPH